MLDLRGLKVLRRNLDAFIRADPIMVALIRPKLVKTSAGGFTRQAPQVLSAQQFRLTTFKRRLSQFTTRKSEGEVPETPYVLVGRWNCDIQRDDEFNYNGDHYLVVSVEPKTDDRTKTDRVVAEVRVEVGDKNPPGAVV